jgi:hypothetical protein
MTFIDNLSPEDLLVLTNAIAISLSKDKSTLEIDVLENFVVGIGCLMLTLASQNEYISLQQETNKSTTTDPTYKY